MPRTTLISEIMSRPVVTATPAMSIENAARLIASDRIGALPVVDEAGRLVGMLRDDDLIVADARLHLPTVIQVLGANIPWPGSQKRFAEELEKVASSTVGGAMDDDPPSITADDTVETVATLMHDRGVTHVAVVDADGVVVGIVARGDIVRLIARAGA